MADGDEEIARKGRFTAIVIAATALFWVLAVFVGGQFDWATRTRALFDLIALAGFVWALVLVYQIWRARRSNQG